MEDRVRDRPLTAHPPFLLGDARIDPPALRIECGGTGQRVEAKVMQVLLALARNPGQVVSRQAFWLLLSSVRPPFWYTGRLCRPLVVMMKPAEDRKRDDLSTGLVD